MAFFDYVIRSRDWHPKNHVSFHSNNFGTNLFDNVVIEKTGQNQIMWPDHCVQGSHGAKYHEDLVLKDTDIEILKGQLQWVESYSAFGGQGEETGLRGKLEDLKVAQVYCCGLAYDFCVGSTAESSAQEGFETFVIKDATRSVNNSDESLMNKKLLDAGVKVINISDISAAL